MRTLFPNAQLRRKIDRALAAFFAGHQDADFDRAIQLFCDFYEVKPPQVEWCDHIGYGKHLGTCKDDGRIDLLYPPTWTAKKLGSDRVWIRVVLHELAHYLFFADAEEKAERFADQFVRGIRSSAKQ